MTRIRAIELSLVRLPLGTVYVEVSKGFEIRPVRQAVEVGPVSMAVLMNLARAYRHVPGMEAKAAPVEQRARRLAATVREGLAL